MNSCLTRPSVAGATLAWASLAVMATVLSGCSSAQGAGLLDTSGSVTTARAVAPASAAGSRPAGSSPAAASAAPSASLASPSVRAAQIGAFDGTVAAELPRGGTKIFPRYRLVGFCGIPGAPALGRLGIGKLDDRAREIERIGKSYAGKREVMPVLELITVVVHKSPGPDGKYRSRISDDIIQKHLEVARAHKALLLLNIQPGKATFIDEVRALEPWLRNPDVGLALDPEWAVQKGVPGRVFGQTSGPELNQVQSYVSDLVTTNGLPEKVVVVHQLSPRIITKESAIRAYPGVALVKSVDGIGSPGAKRKTWRALTATKAPAFHAGFKLFYQEDAEAPSRLMTPAEVMALKPTPEYVMYE